MLRRRGEELWVEEQEWSPTNADSCFNVVLGLAGRAVSFQLQDNPKTYFRHHGGLCFVEDDDGSQIFKDDCTFIVHPVGFAAAITPSISLESINFPGFFISHSENRVQILQYADNDDYKQNSSWTTVAMR